MPWIPDENMRAKCGHDRYLYPHKRNKTNLCNSCFNRKERLDAMRRVNGVNIECSKCGVVDSRVIDIHHQDVDGILDYGMSADGKMIKTPGNNQRFYRLINDGVRDVSDLALLCKNCHHIRHVVIREKKMSEGYRFTSQGMHCLKRKEKSRLV